MSLYLEQRLVTQLRITPQQIIANELLAMSSTDLEQAVTLESEKNPVLEVVEHERCPNCGNPLRGQHCPYCHGRKGSTTNDWEPEGWNPKDYRTRNWEEEDDSDPMSRVPGGPSLAECLMWHVGQTLSPKDFVIAEYLIGSLDSHGYLTVTVEEAARYLRFPDGRVSDVLSEIQKMNPPGIGARGPQEALLIQLGRMREDGLPRPLAEALILNWDLFLRQQHHALARVLGVTEDEVRQEYAFIEANLNPKPAHAFWSMGEAKPAPDTVYIRPDIAIRRRPAPDEGFEVEILPGRSFTLRISPEYKRLMEELETKTDPLSQEAQNQLKDYMAKGKLFIRCVNQRWQTLLIIGNWLVDYQRGFLESGERAIKPITRAELAEQIGVHESTVSRAIANKYALLPNGRVVPLSDFFDNSMAVKHVLLDLVRKEKRPLSDQELAKRLAAEGYPIARRTVAKYRQELDVLPARLRCN
jgi:RNA polymerase sigma-54 factor